MGLQALIAADAAALCAIGDFDEALVITFRSGVTRAVRGWVNRLPPEQYQGVPAPLMEVRVPNSSTAGLTPAELDYGGITVTVVLNPGGTPEPFNVFHVRDGRPFADAGTLRFDLR